MRQRLRSLHRQRGVAVVTALLLTTLAITIVASLFWQQQVQVRSIENQRLQLQKRWILRGALDWASLILRADAGPDHLGEPWAVPLAETRLDQYVENGRADADASDATISGNIIDAQSRFNLRNLLDPEGKIEPTELAVFQNLLTELRLNPNLAEAVAVAFKQSTPLALATASGAPVALPAPTDKRLLSIDYVDDLLAVPGLTPAILDKLRDYVIVLPARTQINANTAPVEILAAKLATLGTLSKADAAVLVASREHAYLKDASDISLRLQKEVPDAPRHFAVATRYFLVNGKVRLNRAALEVQALVDRIHQTTRLVWIREN